MKLLPTVMFCLALAAAAGEDPSFWKFAPTPPMGWNSWDCFGCTVTEARTKANADFMAEKLAAHGWQYIVVDIQWYEPQSKGFDYDPHPQVTMDEWGRLWPVETKFPSSAQGRGFKPLADHVHARGLKFGVHLLRGIPRAAVEKNTKVLGTEVRAADIADRRSTCPWNPDMFGVDMSKPGAQAYYDSVFKLFASWDIDFVKVDDLSRPYHTAEIEGIRKAIDGCGRPMVFSTSPGETPLASGAHVALHANMWRVSDDFWDNWKALKEQFARLDNWTPHRAPGHWPDADMLPLGNVRAVEPKGWTRFTHDEQVTMMTLWSMAKSPLIMGGHLPASDAFTLSLLTNDEVIAVDQRSTNNRQISRQDDLVVWAADAPASPDKYVALFNARDGGIDPKAAVAATGVVSAKTPGHSAPIQADITGAKKLFLVVDDAGDTFACDHADWIEPKLTGPAGPLSLAKQKWISATSGWGHPAVGRSVGGQGLVVDGKPVADGIGTHSVSVIEYDLPAGYTRFEARGGLDQSGVSQGNGATVRFLVFTKDPRGPGATVPVGVDLTTLGLSGSCRVRDLWSGRDLPAATGRIELPVAPHAARLLRLAPAAK